MYDALLPLEETLQEALNEVLVAQADESFAELESILSKSISEVSRQDTGVLKGSPGDGDGGGDDGDDAGDLQQRTPDNTHIVDADTKYTTIKSKAAPDDAAKAAAAAKKAAAPAAKPRNEVRFVRAESLADEEAKRSFAAGSCVYINIDHSDFMDRVDRDNKGRLKFGPRVSARAKQTTPLATNNLLEVTDGLRRPPLEGGGDAIHQCPLDSVALGFC